MTLIMIGLFFVLFPAMLIYLCTKYPVLNKLGPAPLAYLCGISISLTGLLPEGAASVEEILLSVTVPLSIPLMLFSMDLKKWMRLAGRTFLSFGLMMVAVLVATTAAFMMMDDKLDEAWKVAGMLIGVYTGGAPNLSAIGLALKVKEHLLILVNTADMLLGMPWLMFVLIFAQPLFLKFLQPFKSGVTPEGVYMDDRPPSAADENMDFNQYAGILKKDKLLPLSGAFLVSLIIFALSAALYLAAPKEYNMAILMVSVTTLAIGCSFIPKIRNIDMTFQLGQYIILIFCLVIGAMADIDKLFSAATDIFIFVFIVMYGAFAIHVVLARLFKIDADTVIITATAAIMSPPFVPVVASSLKNREVVMSGLATGIFGYAIGNYLGIIFAHVLNRFLV